MKVLGRLVDAILGPATPRSPMFAMTEERSVQGGPRRATIVGLGHGPVPYDAGDRYPDPGGPWVVTGRIVRPVGTGWKVALDVEERLVG